LDYVERSQNQYPYGSAQYVFPQYPEQQQEQQPQSVYQPSGYSQQEWQTQWQQPQPQPEQWKQPQEQQWPSYYQHQPTTTPMITPTTESYPQPQLPYGGSIDQWQQIYPLDKQQQQDKEISLKLKDE